MVRNFIEMNLFKTVKRKKTYINNRSGGCDYDMKEHMFCVSCERPFVVGDYLVRLKQNGTRFDEVITCPNPNCEGDIDYWVVPYAALGILSEIYEDSSLTKVEKVYYGNLVRLMENLLKEK